MADQASATIRISGTISRDLIPALLEAIECDHGLAGWDGGVIDISHIRRGTVLEVYASELVGGRFEHLEAFCGKNGLAYVRNSDPCRGAFEAERAVYTGESTPQFFEINDAGRVVLTHRDLNTLGSIAAANAWFEAGEFALPPLSVATDESPPSCLENGDD